MAVKTISSAENELMKKIIKLKSKKYRDQFAMFVVEGERSVKDAVSSDFSVENVIMTEDFYQNRGGQLFSKENCIVTTESVFGRLCDTKTPQGVLAVVKTKPVSDKLCGNRYIYCDRIQDPGNAGTIIRSADAFGFAGVIFSKGSVDVFSPKVIRSSMGSVFHIEVRTEQSTEFLEKAKKEGYSLCVTALHKSSVPLRESVFTDKQIFVIGNEGNGVLDSVLSLADQVVHIPMQGMAESLNAGVAASVLMYEVSRHE